MLREKGEAYELLTTLVAPDRPVRHAKLVDEATGRLLLEFQGLGVACDVTIVELGAVLHDCGNSSFCRILRTRIVHEQPGEALLVAHGVQPEIARCCVSHAAWDSAEVSLEERTVALADKLWKGKREAALELAIIEEVAVRLGASRWDVFERLDTAFEELAAGGAERVEGSGLA